jgi:hypothetical protein
VKGDQLFDIGGRSDFTAGAGGQVAGALCLVSVGHGKGCFTKKRVTALREPHQSPAVIGSVGKVCGVHQFFAGFHDGELITQSPRQFCRAIGQFYRSRAIPFEKMTLERP